MALIIILLLFAGTSMCGNVYAFQDEFDEIRMELTKLTVRLKDLEKENDDQARKIHYLEHENSENTKKIFNLENELDSLKNRKGNNGIESYMKTQPAPRNKQGGAININNRRTSDRSGRNVESHTKMGHRKEEQKPSTVKSHKHDFHKESTERGGVSANFIKQKMNAGISIGNLSTGVTSSRSEKVRELLEGETPVAFTVVLGPHDYGPLGKDQTIKLDSVITNVGNSYHSHSGAFIAPLRGIYVFFATVAGNLHNLAKNYVHILLNGHLVVKMCVSTVEQSSQLFVLELSSNDEVYLVNTVNGDVFLGDRFTSFSGFLLHQYAKKPVENVVFKKIIMLILYRS